MAECENDSVNRGFEFVVMSGDCVLPKRDDGREWLEANGFPTDRRFFGRSGYDRNGETWRRLLASGLWVRLINRSAACWPSWTDEVSVALGTGAEHTNGKPGPTLGGTPVADPWGGDARPYDRMGTVHPRSDLDRYADAKEAEFDAVLMAVRAAAESFVDAALATNEASEALAEAMGHARDCDYSISTFPLVANGHVIAEDGKGGLSVSRCHVFPEAP